MMLQVVGFKWDTPCLHKLRINDIILADNKSVYKDGKFYMDLETFNKRYKVITL